VSASDNQKPTDEAQGEATLRISDLLAAVVVKAKSEGRKYLHCGDFYHLKEWPGCCVSCHEDNEEYGYDLCSAELGGMDVECCCKVSTWLGEVQAANEKAQ